MRAGSRTSNSCRADRAKVIEYSATKLAEAAEAFFHGVERFSWFAGAITDDDTVIEVFPQLSVSFEIDKHGRLSSTRICNKIDTLHLSTCMTNLHQT